MARLDSVDPALADAIKSADPSTQRAVAVAAARLAATLIALDDAAVGAVLIALERGAAVSPESLLPIHELRDRLDRHSFPPEDGDYSAESLAALSKARAAAAIAFAADPRPDVGPRGHVRSLCRRR